MLWNGASLDTVNNLPIDDALNMWDMHLRGMLGPTTDFITSYMLYSTIFFTNGGKKNKIQSIDDIFKPQFAVIKSTTPQDESDLDPLKGMDRKQLEGAPEWLIEAALNKE